MLNAPVSNPGTEHLTPNTKPRRSITHTQPESLISAITRPLFYEWALRSWRTSRPKFGCSLYAALIVGDGIRVRIVVSKRMCSRRHRGRLCLNMNISAYLFLPLGSIDLPYPCYSVHAELLDPLGLHLPPCVRVDSILFVRFIRTQSRSVNVQR